MIKLILSFKGKALDEYLLSEGETTVGSDPDCTVHIDSLAVAPVHARISKHGDEYTVEEIAPEHVILLNNQKTSNSPLKNNDIILVGKHALKFIVEADLPQVEDLPDDTNISEEQASGVKVGWLQIMSGQNVGKTIQLSNAITNIGKRGSQTAAIARRKGGYYLTHLEGDALPKVAGTPITEESQLLNDGDIIELGVIKMQFYLG